MPQTRRTQRETALKLYYALAQSNGFYDEGQLKQSAAHYELELSDFVRQLIRSSFDQASRHTVLIHEQAKSPDMIAGLDLLLMVQGMCELEMAHSPAKTVINEYIELAKLYGAENAYKFVNVVLNAHRERLGQE